MQEVLRIYPPVGIGQIREATADVSLAGKLAIPRGVLVWVSHYAMHNTNHNWENPEKFDPGTSASRLGAGGGQRLFFSCMPSSLLILP